MIFRPIFLVATFTFAPLCGAASLELNPFANESPVSSNLDALSAAPSPTALQETLSAARSQLDDAQKALEVQDSDIMGATRPELEERVGLLKKCVIFSELHLEALRTQTETERQSDALATEIAAWRGFETAPPYPVELLDQFWAELEAERLALASDEAERAAAQQSGSQARAELQRADRSARQATESLESANSEIERIRSRWLRQLAGLRLETATSLSQATEALAQALSARMALRAQRIDFLLRKLELVAPQVTFSKASLDHRLAQIDAEIADAERILPQSSGPGASPHPNIRAGQDLLIQLAILQNERDLWQKRFHLNQGWSLPEAKAALTTIRSAQDRIASISTLVESSLRAVESLAPSPSASPADLSAREVVLETSRRNLDRIRRLLDVWHFEIESRLTRHRAANILPQLSTWASFLWNYELFAADDTIIVDGQRLVQRRPVTIGKVVRAFILLLLGLLMARWLAKLVTAVAAPFLARYPNGRPIVERLLRVLLIVVVVVVALVSVKIPLTVFAFLGGALAIGVGFGAQNLINNFISSYILMAERPIRVGDTIDLDGTRGVVEHIGSRCTRLRRFDGIDILIPNSGLLEKSVTNLTLRDQRLRLSLSVGVAYGSPSTEVANLIARTLTDHGLILKTPAPVVLFEDFGDSALLFTAYFWIDMTAQPDYRTVPSDIRHMLLKRFQEAGIAIPFPQRDLHIAAPIPVTWSEPSADLATRAPLPAPQPVGGL